MSNVDVQEKLRSCSQAQQKAQHNYVENVLE